MKTFEGRVAAITGASSGIGRALALELARRRCALALASNSNRDGLEETAALARQSGVRVTTQQVDVAQRDQVQAWAVESISEHGGVQLLFNNAGVAYSGTVEGTDYADYEWVMAINYWGVVYGTKAFLPAMIAAGEGHIVNVSSIFGLFAQPGMSAYNSSKFAVRGFTESLRQELDLLDGGVSASCVHPGGIRTNIAKAARMSSSIGAVTGRDQAGSTADFEKLLRTTPESAAKTILNGVRRNARRILVGADAVAADGMQRALPSLYQGLVTNSIRLLKKTR